MFFMVSEKSKKDNASRIRKKFIPDPGGKTAPIPDPQDWLTHM
jgi:hypothetical protein